MKNEEPFWFTVIRDVLIVYDDLETAMAIAQTYSKDEDFNIELITNLRHQAMSTWDKLRHISEVFLDVGVKPHNIDVVKIMTLYHIKDFDGIKKLLKENLDTLDRPEDEKEKNIKSMFESIEFIFK